MSAEARNPHDEHKERIGVYVCHCGSNIAGTVDVEDVAVWAKDALGDDGVVISRDYKFMCSSLGQELIERDIENEGLTRVVVAACSPHLHEQTFRNACDHAGLNPYLCELVSIREQVSWVHTDRAAATAKAKAVIAGGVERVIENEPLEPLHVPIDPHTLVVGGGIAGIQAALEIADAGHKVYLVEREPSIGGHMAQFDKTFPTLDCAACILTPKMVTVGNHPNIEMLTWSEVVRVDGYVGNFTVTIKQKPRYVDTDLCTGCGICWEKCPKKVIDDVFEAGLGYRKAVYTPFAQAVPKYPVIDTVNCTYFQNGKCRACEKLCPTEAIDFTQQETFRQVTVGNIILATGFDVFDARRIPQYGYGRLANVFTSIEFERMCNAAGPTNGEIVLRDGVTQPRSVAIIHCVGSRDRNYNNYCSAICCMASLKFAHLVKERTGAQVYNFYIDMRTAYKDYDEFYQRLLEEGTLFVRGRVAEVTDAARLPGEEGKLIIQAEDTLAGRQRRVPVDMVILAAGLEPRVDANEVARLFGISCSANGWFIEKHPKLDPVATMTEGIFIAGAVQGPKDIPSSVAQGAAAAARVLNRIGRGEIELEPVRATVDAAKCSGCRICNNLCPFNAIIFHEDLMVTEINHALCQGCGTCVAACPAGAISGSGFSNEQILAQIEGLLMFNGANLVDLVPA
ncbi:MAG: CoB--CoM heterodisulfide reductase iron-sulfur subunit A family protein [Anaerolineales bacterium]|nr:CoB--CoM heterodisulfide reductase iron-sulfur subunit A family protein [Anaerolineales bacterium]MCB8951934.1 CoB--CoM heterodisulfide reductase iron-sulfur subunit A family protein [Ardenticatenales bacterium]